MLATWRGHLKQETPPKLVQEKWQEKGGGSVEATGGGVGLAGLCHSVCAGVNMAQAPQVAPTHTATLSGVCGQCKSDTNGVFVMGRGGPGRVFLSCGRGQSPVCLSLCRRACWSHAVPTCIRADTHMRCHRWRGPSRAPPTSTGEWLSVSEGLGVLDLGLGWQGPALTQHRPPRWS